MKRSLSITLRIATASLIMYSITPAFAASRLLGILGYENLRISHADDDLTGLHLAGIYQVETIMSNPQIILTFGGGLGYSNVSYSKSGVESTLAEPQVKLEAGASFFLAPATIQVMGGFDLGLFGETTNKIKGPNAITITATDTVDRFMRLNLLGRATFNVTPTISLGGELGWFTGSLKIKDGDTSNIHGYSLAFVVSTTLQ